MVLLPQHRLLYFFPEPHGHASFRPTLKACAAGHSCRAVHWWCNSEKRSIGIADCRPIS